jgi:hypothetical protein
MTRDYPLFVSNPAVPYTRERCGRWLSTPANGPWLRCPTRSTAHSWWVPPDAQAFHCLPHFRSLHSAYPRALFHLTFPECFDPGAFWNARTNRCELPAQQDEETRRAAMADDRDWDDEFRRIVRELDHEPAPEPVLLRAPDASRWCRWRLFGARP